VFAVAPRPLVFAFLVGFGLSSEESAQLIGDAGVLHLLKSVFGIVRETEGIDGIACR